MLKCTVERMKNLKLGVFAALVGGILAFGSAEVRASNHTDVLNLNGNIPQLLQITVAALGGASSLDLTLNVSTPVKVANVNAQSNLVGGYKITVASTNTCTVTTKPCFLSATVTEQLAFDLHVGTGSALTWTTKTATFVADTNAKSSNPGVGDAYDANVSYDGTAVVLAEATDYAETLTFTIAVP